MDDDADARAKSARQTCPFLTAKQTAFHLGIAPSTLKAMRLAGKGPRCRMHGRTWRYHIDDIEAWSAASARGGNHG
ncbi:helix-turn-helix domain-containing protein [Sphingomonas cannabina]|uniref:helix-turn-helix transcriptional regulator n=1 Tax=Sphingomonas cannabina TaxID=2899123 RepID=UPI001F300C4B|nr:helix-turn-helix domain-containing protein [Sphingomonas cannabina]UIJ46261.1 helix-turn-helix domain-containing protein [Sphingomonas cannabina]